LSIALSIVQAHGGEITLANRAPATACAGPSGLRASILLPRQG
jgi:signal transduction histidine kinase